MNDEHDPDSQSMHEDVPDHDHPVQAPVDDFSDAGSSTEETATISQEAASDGEDAISAEPEKRSRSMLPVFVVIIGILIVGGGLAYWQFGRSTSSSEEAMVSKPMPSVPVKADAKLPEPVVETPVAAKAVDNVPPAQQASNSGSRDINALYKPTVDASPAPSASASAGALQQATNIANTPPLPVDASSAVPAAVPSPVMQLPTVTPQNTAPAVVSPTTKVAASVPTSAVSANASPSRIDALTSRIDELQRSLDQANKQLSEVTEAQSAMAASAQGGSAIEDRLNKIEQNMTQLESQKAATKKSEAKPSHNGVKKASGQVKLVAKHKHPTKKAAVAKAASSSPEQAKVSSSWVLRAATPNEAWISGDATSADLRHVQVGDSLPGIGKVKAISQSSRGWEVEGTESTVR